jgi:diguanylate cyclase (GGDEF)-like protein
MQTANALSLTPAGGDYEALADETGPEAMLNRLRRRRRVMGLAAVSQAITVLILIAYAAAGTISTTLVFTFAASASALVLFFLGVSESGLTNGGRDHYFGLPYAATTFGLLLAFVYIAPQVAVVFLCAMFLVINVVALRATARQAIVIWATMTACIAGIFFLTDLPIAMPFDTAGERFATLTTFALTMARSMFIGVYASSLRDALYRRGINLQAAYKRIEELAELDELTGSFNRRCIMRLLDDEIVRAQRSKSPCSVALIDLDWFKRINDSYGHQTGDEVLRTFAITIFANIRNNDKFGRYGGEEFLLVLPDTPHQAAMQIVDRLRQIVATLDWSAFSDGLSVTISAGVATLGSTETAEALLARADSALYAAKERGRNRIAVA